MEKDKKSHKESATKRKESSKINTTHVVLEKHIPDALFTRRQFTDKPSYSSSETKAMELPFGEETNQ